MANIIQMRMAPAETKPRVPEGTKRSAEIVIFPGIRYERWSASDQQPDAGTKAPARDILKLVE